MKQSKRHSYATRKGAKRDESGGKCGDAVNGSVGMGRRRGCGRSILKLAKLAFEDARDAVDKSHGDGTVRGGAGFASQGDVAMAGVIDIDMPAGVSTQFVEDAIDVEYDAGEIELGICGRKNLPAFLECCGLGELVFERHEREVAIEQAAKSITEDEADGGGEFVIPEILKAAPCS